MLSRALIVGQCVAIVVAVGRNAEIDRAALLDFLVITLFAQLTAVGGALALRALGPFLERLGAWTRGAAALGVLALVTVAVAEVVLYALFELGATLEAWPEWHVSVLLRALIISAIVGALMWNYMLVYQQATTETKAQHDDRLQVLHSRIRPHFLFNSMNSVASLIRSNPELAEKALEDLADVYRVVLADARKMVPITAESQLARQYLDLEKMRLGDRLNVKWTLSNVPRSALMPSLTLQPLLENAVYHGIEPSFAGGTVTVQMWGDGEGLHIVISNPLPELSASASHRRGNQIAMANVRERLERHFGNRASLQNMEKLGNYYVKIKIPIVRGSGC